MRAMVSKVPDRDLAQSVENSPDFDQILRRINYAFLAIHSATRRSLMAKKKQTIILRPGIDIGALAAEHDGEYRSSCSVEVPAIEQITGDRNNRSILLARTGAGKSAILFHLEEKYENVSRIDPKDASFQYVSSSTIVQSLVSIGVDLHVFYEYLWKHVLCIHIVSECLGVRSNDKFQAFMRKVETLLLGDRRKEIVYEYLKRWEGRFWISADEVSREVISEIEGKLAARLGLSRAFLLNPESF